MAVGTASPMNITTPFVSLLVIHTLPLRSGMVATGDTIPASTPKPPGVVQVVSPLVVVHPLGAGERAVRLLVEMPVKDAPTVVVAE